MTRKQAFRRALTFKETRPVPFCIKFTVEARENYERFLGKPFDPVADTGSYVVASHTNNGWTEVKPGYWKDYFGVIWNKTADRTLGVVDCPVFREPSFGGGYTFPEPASVPVYEFIRQNNRRYPDHYHMVSIGFALFERAWSLCGMPELMMWMMTDGQFVHDLLDRIADYNVALIRNAAIIGGIDCVHYGDDWGSQHGPLIAPDTWREFIKPRFKRMCDTAKECGLANSLHCCGNVTELMPDIIECGVDVFDPFQPEAMDIWELRKTYKGRIAFWGGLSVQQTLPHGTPDDIRRESRELLEKMGKDGGYVFSPSHALTGDIPAENIRTVIEIANNQEAIVPAR